MLLPSLSFLSFCVQTSLFDSLSIAATGSPLAKGLGLLPTKTLSNFPIAGAAFVPPISVQAAAKAAVAAATDPAVPAGIMDVWQMKEYEN